MGIWFGPGVVRRFLPVRRWWSPVKSMPISSKRGGERFVVVIRFCSRVVVRGWFWIVSREEIPETRVFLCEPIVCHKGLCGRVPRQVAAEGGFASVDNLRWAKGEGIREVMCSK